MFDNTAKNLFEEIHNPKMTDLCGSLIEENNLEVHWELEDQLVLDFGPEVFLENHG